ncbi:MAG: P-loop NTPase fold protein [Bacteroidota bacterium]
MQSMKAEFHDIIAEIRESIGNAQYEEAINGLLEFTQLADQQHYDYVMMLKARWSALERDRVNGIITYENEQVVTGQIAEALLTIINDLKPDFDQVYMSGIQNMVSNQQHGEAFEAFTTFTRETENPFIQSFEGKALEYEHRYQKIQALDAKAKTNAQNELVEELLDRLDQFKFHQESGASRKEDSFVQKEIYLDTESEEIPSPSVEDDLAARIAAILQEPIIDLFPAQQPVEVRFDSMFDAEEFDVVVAPQSPNGRINRDIARGLRKWDFTFESEVQELGTFRLQGPFTGPDGLRYLALATSVGIEKNSSNLEAIEQLGAGFGRLSLDTDDRRRFIAPLLGSGWGGLDPVKAYEALERGFLATADPNAILTVHIIDQEAFQRVNQFIRNRLFAPKPPVRSSYSPDTSSGKDQLEIMHEVQSFANLIASQDLQPPLSIGLFGDWGTGKSFFMEKLHDEVDRISLEARAQEGDTGIHGRIAQIKFNAWYYVDSNLWASMVTRIFDNLASFLGIKSEEEERESQLYENLASTQEQVQVAERAQLAIQNEITTLEEELETLKQERQRKRKELEGVRLKHLAKTVQDDKQVKELMDKAQAELGFQQIKGIGEEIQQSKAQVQGLIDRYSTTRGRIVQVYRRIMRWNNPRMYLYFALLLFIPLGAYYLLKELPASWNIDEWDKMLARVGSIVASLGIVLRQIIDEADPILQKVNMGIDYLSQAESRMDQLRDVASAAVDEQIAALEQEYSQLNDQYQTAQSQKWEAEKQLKLVEKEIEDIKTGKRLESYIQNRVRSSDYQQHLGLISLIREDFDRLSQYLEKNQSETAVKKVFTKIEEQDRLDRIILYIDDLDRCPPDRVVEVLQAIHLILAFKLFVVVVGVDVRWVSRSLLQRYGTMLTTQENTLTDDPELKLEIRESATPFDYLEKIFQIPFRLQSMSNRQKEKYVRALMKNDLEVSLQAVGSETTSGVKPNPEKILEPSSEEIPPIPQEETEERAESLKNEQTTVEVEDLDGEKTAPLQELRQKRSKATVLKEAESPAEEIKEVKRWDRVKLTQNEIDFIAALTPLAGDSPRTLKRFVNVARLIKSNPNWLPPAEDVKNTKPYLAGLLMLAVVVGSPWMTPLIFALMQEEKDNGLTLGQLVETNELKLGEEIDKHRYINREWDRFRAFILQAKDHETPELQAIYYMNIGYLNDHVKPIVSRFSFRASNELRTSIQLSNE